MKTRVPTSSAPAVLRDPLAGSFAEVLIVPITLQRQSNEHSFTRRIETTPILDRAQPKRFFEAAGDERRPDAQLGSGDQFVGSALGFDMLNDA